MENIGDTICLHRIVLDSIYYESALVYNTQNTRVSGLAVDAAIELFDYDSYVRLILVDEDSDTEYLVFDAYYPKNMIDTMFNIRQYAHETTSLFNIATSHLQIEVGNAVCAIENIYYSDKYNTKTPEQYYADKLLNKTIQDSIILECINHRLRQENKIWVAGNTSLLQMTYDQRKAILSKNENNEIPNLQGFEYYIGGVFDLQPYDLDNRERSSYVDDFDWRDRHGQNWTTVAKNQFSCNSCWAFAPISAAENVINLYFNRHLDYDLSEQELLSCSNAGDCQARGGFMPTAINYLLNNGVVSENCFPYVNSKVPCNNICSTPDEHIAFSNAPGINTGMDNIKQAIINSGSICILIDNIWHYMAICGFKLLKIGDVVYDGTGTTLPNSTTITIGPNSPYIGQNCWLFKNSWGPEWGDDGFGYVITRSDKLLQAYKLVNPISDTLSYQDIICEDQDGDGYYNWGIGPKPATCPNCPNEPDCDDSDPALGPYDAQYGCTSFCESGFVNIPLYINGSTTWNTPMQINRDIEILNGATLNICNTTIWELSSDCSIIVHPGGRLILDGATITNPCGIMWKGIEVWGDSHTHQHEVNGGYLQGYIELKNGAIIENAKCAVELWQPGDYSTTGGIIHATDATFRNNAKAVRALNYTYSPSGGTFVYNGHLHKCTFTIDEDYLGTEPFNNHVELAHIGGFYIKGCSFSAMRSVNGVSPYCMGIEANTAGFLVDSYCDHPNGSNMSICPEENLIHSSFSNFYQGIHTSGDGSRACGFIVRNSVFENNTTGLYVFNTGSGTVVNNDFTVDCGSDCDFGIYVEMPGLFIEDNTFHPKTTNTGSPYGIVIVNSKGITDVYNNSFLNLRCGNVAIGDNKVVNNTPSLITEGLTYTCNTNSGNAIDFCVLKDDNTGGIASPQGTWTVPAGNTFAGSQYHFYNDGTPVIIYYYDINGTNQQPTLVYGVSASGTQGSNSCHSHYNGGSITKSASEKETLASDYLSARSTYNSLLQLYESRIDGGSTTTQVADINNAVPSDMWRLRSQLLGISPYVSAEVLTTAADRYDVFSDPVLFEILAANPDELQHESLISYLENKEHPLPTYMTELLRQIALGFTTRTALLGQMAQYSHEYRLAAGDIVRSCLFDSITDLSELRTWLANMDNLASDRMIVASYLQEGDSIHAFALANMLPELYGLQGDDLADHADYMRLIGMYQTLNRENRTVHELTDAEIAMVNGIAASGTGTSRAMAKALLMERSDENISSSNCPTMPGNNGGNKGLEGSTDASLNEALGFTASVSPNPATTWTTVAYTLPAKATSATISLTNALGVTVATYELTGNESQKVLDLRGLANGVYTYAVRCGKYSQTGKIIITK
ncbi:MAG: T9SS type A sorting domain-containing protein [Bacteroidales bacterium]|nr:T9SS type A sorting domain-containing protein [Bacteroidales bacterium]